MNTLNSVLTISENINYGECVRLTYEAQPIDTYYIPSFVEASSIVQIIMPDTIILDLRQEDFTACKFFLGQVLGIQQRNPDYSPSILVSEETSEILRQLLVHQPIGYSFEKRVINPAEGLILEVFPTEVLMGLLDFTIAPVSNRNMVLSGMPLATNSAESRAQLLAL